MSSFYLKNKGYSLLETIIYVTLFSMISIAILSTIDFSSRIYRNTRVNTVMTDSGNNVLERVSRSIRGADEISSNSVFNSANGILELTNPDGTTVRFDISSNSVRLTENGTVSGNLTGSSVVVTSLLFRKITTSHGYGIKTELVLSNPNSGKIESFQTTTILRNAY